MPRVKRTARMIRCDPQVGRRAAAYEEVGLDISSCEDEEELEHRHSTDVTGPAGEVDASVACGDEEYSAGDLGVENVSSADDRSDGDALPEGDEAVQGSRMRLRMSVHGFDFREGGVSRKDVAAYRDKEVTLCSLEAGEHCISELQLLRNTMLSFRATNKFGPGIELVSRCPPFGDPCLQGTIKVAKGFFRAGLRLPLSELTAKVMNFVGLAPHKFSCNSFFAFFIMDRLNSLAEYGNGTIDLVHFFHYFYVMALNASNPDGQYTISKRSKATSFFKTPNRTNYGGKDNGWMEVGGAYYMGATPVTPSATRLRRMLIFGSVHA